MDAEGLRKLGQAYTEAWNRMDPARVASFHDETSFLKVNDAEPAVGKEAIAEVAQGFMTAFPDMVLEMDAIRPTDVGAEYHWTYSGTNTGPGGTGNAVRFSGYEEWTLDERGLITQSLGHFDEDEYDRQLEHGVDGSEASSIHQADALDPGAQETNPVAVPERAIHYLEIVTPDVDAACVIHENAHGWQFSEPHPELGNARLAELPDGALCGIRAPMHEQEKPTVRTYVRVPDIESAVDRAVESGGVLAVEPMEIPGRGRIAIYLHGGVEQGLWELP